VTALMQRKVTAKLERALDVGTLEIIVSGALRLQHGARP